MRLQQPTSVQTPITCGYYIHSHYSLIGYRLVHVGYRCFYLLNFVTVGVTLTLCAKGVGYSFVCYRLSQVGAVGLVTVVVTVNFVGMHTAA